MVAGRVSTFTCMFIFISNSCEIAVRGTVNGIGQTLVAICRMLGPTVGSIMFAWSMSNGASWPLDYHFVWYVLAAIGMLSYYMIYRLPVAIEQSVRDEAGSGRRSAAA